MFCLLRFLRWLGKFVFALGLRLLLRLQSSTGRSPVSLLIRSLVDVGVFALAMSISSFSFVGIRIAFASAWYSGIFHWSW